MSGFDNEILYAEGIDLTDVPPNVTNKLGTDGFVYIGNSAGRPIAALPTSSDGSLTITGGNGSLDLTVTGGSGSGELGAVNLGLTYSAGTATIKGADGNDLSATNPGFITLRSNVTAGALVTYTMTSNFSWDDANGASSVFTGSLFGMTTGDTTTGARITLFYLYAMSNATDTDFSFFTCRYPNQIITRTKTGFTLKDAGSGNADTYADTLALEVLGANLSDYQNANAQMIGSFTALINGSDDWTIAGVGGTAGIGRYFEFFNAVHSKGIMGQATNSYFLPNGGTAPTDTTAADNQFQYRIDYTSGVLNVFIDTTFQGSPAGAVDAIINLPIQGPNQEFLADLDGTIIVGGNFYSVKLRQVGTTLNTTHRQFFLFKADGTTSRWQYNEFSNGDRLIVCDSLILR